MERDRIAALLYQGIDLRMPLLFDPSVQVFFLQLLRRRQCPAHGGRALSANLPLKKHSSCCRDDVKDGHSLSEKCGKCSLGGTSGVLLGKKELLRYSLGSPAVGARMKPGIERNEHGTS